MKTPAVKTSSGKASRAVAHSAPAKEKMSSFAAKLPAVAAGESGVAQLQPNRTGLPDQLKSGIEQLSGYSMDNVKVHYNSPAPAQLQAHAYAQGTDIHIAPGQEKHLPHEAWHVVQQKQGRVQATTQLKSIAVNDSPALEKEADVMGAKAVQGKFYGSPAQLKTNTGVQVAQLASYRSKADPLLTVNVNAGNNGVYAEAIKTGEKYEESSLQYALNRYTDGNNPPATKVTGVPMATQTYTMHSYPERGGVGTLMVAEAMRFMQGRHIRYFQPDEAISGGGKIMRALISGTARNAQFMEALIAQTDGGNVAEDQGCGCWAAFTSLFSSKKKQPENKPLLPQVRTYPAIEVDYGATAGTLGGKVAAKFDVI